MGPTDLEVIERSWEQPEAFADLFHRYFAIIHGYCARRAGVDRADDLACETFRIAFERREHTTGRGQTQDRGCTGSRTTLCGTASVRMAANGTCICA